MDKFNMIIELFGGLGLFLFGMKLMGDGLENAAGNKLKNILEKVTRNKIIGVLVGAAVTAVIQSSSATTVMVVSFVNAGLMTLSQATGVIMGACIGTTITAQMVSFNLNQLAPIFVGVGAIALLSVKKKKSKDLASIVLGFGILFLGMGIMSGAMKPLTQSDAFRNIVEIMGSNRFLGVLAGLGMTAIVQSSSATTGMLIALATTGSIDIHVALPIILGCNIGTCVTALLASASANKKAKKAAIIHLLFKVIGVIIVLPFLNYLAIIVEYINPTDVARQVANAHTIFNVSVTLILLPLSEYLIKIVDAMMPENEEDEVETDRAIYLDKNLLETPVLAIGQAYKETVRMGEIAKKNIEEAMYALLNNNEEKVKEVYKREKIINNLEQEITDYLVLLSSHELPEKDSKILSATFHVINDIERIGDHAENIADMAIEKMNKEISFGEEATEEVELMYKKTLEALTLAIESYRNEDSVGAKNISVIEEGIDKYEKKLRNNNIKRLNGKLCNANSSTMFLDLISNLERIGDHSNNISEAIM